MAVDMDWSSLNFGYRKTPYRFVAEYKNGKWDEGNYALNLQPEEVYYYHSPLRLRAKWDLEQTWNLSSRPLGKQKPMAITKQKPDKEKKIQNRNIERAKKWK